ncbi:MBOAT family O-acyltransferase [Enterocloster lavalensis]|uniref:MBOAT family O-acyltransferase n=1 Tax=Enterocloster lavalensis TaxID=460384 RepID=UPI001D072D8B|nr:MBOAT family O-acyltransferase [Enterocloster lavalensis]MCB6341690.1 MBOAT family protein [Enterocloster lavalensis]
MVFSSPVFLFLFLPVTLALYAVASAQGIRVRNTVLLFCSICFYAYGGVSYLGLLLMSVLVNWAAGLWLSRLEDGRGRRAVFLAGLAYNIGILVIFKYLNLFGDTAAWIAGKLSGRAVESIIPAIALPIGISFFTFQIMSYLIDVYKKTVPCQKNVADLALYVMLFPQLIAGPIVRYSDVEREIGFRRTGLGDAYEGAFRFMVGFIKKILLANAMGKAADLAFVLEPGRGALYAWVGVICYGLQIYLDFWAYSDMAIGLGRIFGFHFLENFNDPYISKSISEFWRRWHISLSTWFRDYVYIPLGGSREGLWKNCRNYLVVFALTGIWHGASWNFLLWGLYFAAFLILEKLWLRAMLERLPAILRHIYVLLVVGIGWVLFRADTMAAAAGFLGDMFSLTLMGTHERELAELLCGGKFLLQFAVSVLFCTPVFTRLHDSLEERRLGGIGDGIVLLFFVLAVCEMMASGYNPFIYFRF